MEKSRSLILKEAKELRQLYYYEKQWVNDFENKLTINEELLLMFYSEREGVSEELIKYWFRDYNEYLFRKQELSKLKSQVDKLPHIPNKKELKEIRRQKHKANNNK